VKLVSNLRQKIKNKVIAANDKEKLGKDGQREIKRNVAQKVLLSFPGVTHCLVGGTDLVVKGITLEQ
jgi:hypothetical protein